jgi:hypothetical protein
VRVFSFLACLESGQCCDVRFHFLLVEVVVSYRHNGFFLWWMDVVILVTVRWARDG